MIPLESVDRQVEHICLIIYDVTDVALSRNSQPLRSSPKNQPSGPDRK